MPQCAQNAQPSAKRALAQGGHTADAKREHPKVPLQVGPAVGYVCVSVRVLLETCPTVYLML